MARPYMARLSASTVDLAFDGAGAVGQGESGGNRGVVAAQAGHEGVQGGQVVGLHGVHPAVEWSRPSLCIMAANAATCRRTDLSAGQRARMLASAALRSVFRCSGLVMMQPVTRRGFGAGAGLVAVLDGGSGRR